MFTEKIHSIPNKKAGKSLFFQPKLTINNPNDKYEREADAMADKVMRMEQPQVRLKPLPISSIQRKCEHCEEEEKMQRKEMNGEETTADSNLENYVGGLSSSGQPLPNEVRNFYEPRFGYDFRNVKVHTDTVAGKSAQSINALAYTSGNNIVFNDGQYSPNTDSGKRLIGHELTHVVQQQQGLRTISRATYKVGNATVNIDYGNVASFISGQYEPPLLAAFTIFTGKPGIQFKLRIQGLSDEQKRLLLYAIDLLNDNPLKNLDKTEAIDRLVSIVPTLSAHPWGAAPGNRAFENEVLRASGWFEKALTTKLTDPSKKNQQLLDVAYNHSLSGSTGTGSACPSVRSASQQLDEPKLRTNLPPKVNALLQSKVDILKNKGIKSQNLSDILPIADIVQKEALQLFGFYIGSGRLKDFLQGWQFSTHITASTSPNAIPADARLAFLANRATGIADESGLFQSVHFDSRCAADSQVMDDIIDKLNKDATIISQLNSIMSWTSFTAQDGTTADTVLNLQYFSKEGECEARWRIIKSLCHEMLHAYVHPDFVNQSKGRRIVTEGFTEVLADQLYKSIRAKAFKDHTLRTSLEGGLSIGACVGVTIPLPDLGYGDDGQFASGIRAIVGDDNFRAAYFLGQNTLAGLQPKLQSDLPGDVYEQEADKISEQVTKIKTDQLVYNPQPLAISTVQRKCTHCEGEEKKMQRKEMQSDETKADNNLENYVGSLSSSGQPLANEIRNFYEPRFGYDFSNVKVHIDTVAAKSAQSINALAYTSGNNIVFNERQYTPGTDKGKRLLGHELTHVIQQGNRTKAIQRDAIPDNLKLPCKWGDYFFEENKINGIRILISMAEADRKSLPSIKQVVTQIESDNKTISDTKFQVKTCIISPNTTRFALYMGEPVLMIDPSDADLETIRHELGHAIFHFISHNKGVKIDKQTATDDWLTDLADIFLQLKGITLQKDKDNSITANYIVDPSEWSPGAKAEHPNDADEFFASAKAAFQTDKEALKATFEKYGKSNKAVTKLGQRLMALLEFLFSKNKLSKQTLASDAGKIKEHLEGVGEPSKVENTLSMHQLTDMLLDPEKRKKCK